MKGKKTDPLLIAQIDILRRNHRSAEIIKIMKDRTSARTVYRILARLKKQDQKRQAEDERRRREELLRQNEIRKREAIEYIEKVLALRARKYKSVADFPPNLRKVRSF